MIRIYVTLMNVASEGQIEEEDEPPKDLKGNKLRVECESKVGKLEYHEIQRCSGKRW